MTLVYIYLINLIYLICLWNEIFRSSCVIENDENYTIYSQCRPGKLTHFFNDVLTRIEQTVMLKIPCDAKNNSDCDAKNNSDTSQALQSNFNLSVYIETIFYLILKLLNVYIFLYRLYIYIDFLYVFYIDYALFI